VTWLLTATGDHGDAGGDTRTTHRESDNLQPPYCCSAAATNSTASSWRSSGRACRGAHRTPQGPLRREAAWASVKEIHARRTVDAVRTGQPLSLATSQGFRWSPRFADSVAASGRHLAACQLALTEPMVLHPSPALTTPTTRGDLASARSTSWWEGARDVPAGAAPGPIIDLDAHPGDGTYRLARRHEGLALFDIAGGSWVDVVNTAAIEYHVARDAGQYEAALQRLGPFLDRARPNW